MVVLALVLARGALLALTLASVKGACARVGFLSGGAVVVVDVDFDVDATARGGVRLRLRFSCAFGFGGSDASGGICEYDCE